MPPHDYHTFKKSNQKINFIKCMAVLGKVYKKSAKQYTDNRPSLAQNLKLSF